MEEKQIATVTRRLGFALSQIMSILTYKKLCQHQLNRVISLYVNISKCRFIFTLHHSIIKSIDAQNIQILLTEKRSVLHIFPVLSMPS